MGTFLLLLLVASNVALLWLVVVLLRRTTDGGQSDAISQLASQNARLQQNLTTQLSSATADIAMRLEQTKGDLRQQFTDRLTDGFETVRRGGRADGFGAERTIRRTSAGAGGINIFAFRDNFAAED